jgi:putative MFS transporter
MGDSSPDNDNENIGSAIGTRIDYLGRIPVKRSILIAISLSSFFALYDVSNFQYISPVLKSDWHLTDAQIAYVISMRILGQVIGAFCISLYADWEGRKPALMITLTILALGSALISVSVNIIQVSVFSLLAGIGIGAEVVIATAYIGEMSPRSKRGRYTSIIFLIGTIGLSASGPVSYLLLQESKILGIDSWRIVMIIPAAVALVLLRLRFGMLESPRWLLSKGKIKETNMVLEKLGLAPIEDQDIKSDITNTAAVTRRNVLLYALNNKKVLSRMFLFISAWFLILVPTAASTLLVVEYVNQGYTTTQSVAITMVGGIGYVVGACLSIIIADKVERKY